MDSHHQICLSFYTQQECVCRMEPKQGHFNLVSNDIPHIGIGFIFVSFDIPKFS